MIVFFIVIMGFSTVAVLLISLGVVQEPAFYYALGVFSVIVADISSRIYGEVKKGGLNDR